MENASRRKSNIAAEILPIYLPQRTDALLFQVEKSENGEWLDEKVKLFGIDASQPRSGRTCCILATSTMSRLPFAEKRTKVTMENFLRRKSALRY